MASTTFHRNTLQAKTAVVTGGTGSLGSAIAIALAQAGAAVTVTGRTRERIQVVLDAIATAGGTGHGAIMDSFDRASIRGVMEAEAQRRGAIHILVNCIGGNLENATTSNDRPFFDLEADDLAGVLELNWLRGTVLPCQEFARAMIRNPDGGSIINISSMAALRPLTRIPAYSAAKAAVENFTRWLAVHLATEYSPKLRVNAIAPGFFLSEQNRFLLQGENGEMTERGRRILEHTPMGRFGEADEVGEAAVWLASDAARFVTGVVVPVDGGFSAFAGV